MAQVRVELNQLGLQAGIRLHEVVVDEDILEVSRLHPVVDLRARVGEPRLDGLLLLRGAAVSWMGCWVDAL